MKTELIKCLLLMTILTAFGNPVVHAQISFVIADSRENNIVLSGTSTFSDWRMKTKTFTGNALFKLTPGTDILGLQSLDVSIPVKALKSNKKALNKNAYKALKANNYREIQYKMENAKIIRVENYVYQIATTGSLTVAGVSKQVNIDVYCVANKNGSITCTGSYKIKMTDYDVEPPTFLDGLMSTDENVDLQFTMRFER